MVFNFNHLHYFHVAASEGSISAAARRLSLTQPGLSTQIRQFERSVGHPLFIRDGRRLTLSPLGRVFFEHTTRMFSEAERLAEKLEGTDARKAKLLRIGVAEGVERPFSVRLARELSSSVSPRHAPFIRLVAGSHEGLLPRLLGQELDAVLTDRASSDALVIGEYEMPVVMAVARGASGGGARKLFAGLKRPRERATSLDVGLVVPTRNFRIRNETDRFLRRHGLSARVILESDLLASVVRAVVDGVGAGFLPLPYLAEPVREGRVIAGPREGLWKHGLRLLVPKTDTPHPLVPALRQAFRSLERQLRSLEEDTPYFPRD